MPSSNSGFSLIEVLVAILIIAILATAVGVAVLDLPDKARVAKAKEQIGDLCLALDRYALEQGEYPTEQQGLDALCRKPTTAPIPKTYPDGGYWTGLEIPKDPWGEEYAYSMPGPEGKAYEIICYGKDKTSGGEGVDEDISSLTLQ
jgi:general secretion pathway protein G